ncbi:hypothetical protein [Parasphingorhabdus sp.]|uniref:hypothetical protein n=1 Tax=Parasphingorhabdus sp. TaxID=2709688 RepID=UPI003D2B17E5
MIAFDNSDDWRTFVKRLDIDASVPTVIGAKYRRAQKLLLLGWIDVDLVKASELVALTTLELALTDRYGHQLSGRKRSFSALLRHMVEVDGLTDNQVPLIVRCGGTVIDRIIGKSKPSIAELRNKMAHGDPFDGLPYAGLLELVRDLIAFAYRDFNPHSTNHYL